MTDTEQERRQQEQFKETTIFFLWKQKDCHDTCCHPLEEFQSVRNSKNYIILTCDKLYELTWLELTNEWWLRCLNRPLYSLFLVFASSPNPWSLKGSRPSPNNSKERHKKAWLILAKTYLDEPQSLWTNVLWADENRVLRWCRPAISL